MNIVFNRLNDFFRPVMGYVAQNPSPVVAIAATAISLFAAAVIIIRKININAKKMTEIKKQGEIKQLEEVKKLSDINSFLNEKTTKQLTSLTTDRVAPKRRPPTKKTGANILVEMHSSHDKPIVYPKTKEGNPLPSKKTKHKQGEDFNIFE